MLPSLALAFGLAAFASGSQAIALAASPSCGAAWISESARIPYWVRFSATEGALAIGSEIVARLAFEGTRILLLSRERPLRSLAGTHVARDADPALLKIDARFSIDSSCILAIHGPVQNTDNPQLLDQATAFSLLGKTLDAEAADDSERAGLLATAAFHQLSGITISELPQKLEIAAYAVEKLLEAGHPDQAADILAVDRSDLFPLPPDHPSRLRFELARARAMSFSDANREALNIRNAIQPFVLATFGPYSDESFSNQVRIANLRLELGEYSQARVQLEAGALLHDIGHRITHRGHHKHGEYLALNGDIPGLEGRDRNIVAAVVRYHNRKSTPNADHPSYSALNNSDKRIARSLAAILRIAEGLDHSHRQRVQDLRASFQRGAVTIQLRVRGEAAEDIRDAERSSALFEREFHTHLYLRPGNFSRH